MRTKRETTENKSHVALIFAFSFSLLTTISIADPVNFKSGISVSFEGTQGVDWQEEVFWYKPEQDDAKVVYIKDTTNIIMFHNALNEMQTNGGLHETIGANGGG